MQEHASIEELQSHAKSIRRTIVELIYRAKSSHIGCSLSAADILTALYFGVLRIDPHNPAAAARDRFVLSKGHAVSALYAALAERGFFPRAELEAYGKEGSRLASHVVKGALPGLETSNGSGGHGLALGIGMALAAREDKNDARVFVLSGDGETEEGSVWEALLFAGHYELSNLTFIVDRNHLQDGVDGLRTDNILDIEPFADKLTAFRWDVETVDGHNFEELLPALRNTSAKPRVIIANTLKGKGVSYMEDKGEWHGKCPNPEEYEIAMRELAS